MDPIDIATDLATLTNEQKHIRTDIAEIKTTLISLVDMNRNVKTYKRLTWTNLGVILVAAGASLFR